MKAKLFTVLIFLVGSLLIAQEFINIGSTKSDVRNILGEPNSINQMSFGEVWSYGDEGLATITFKSGRINEFNNYKNVLPIGEIRKSSTKNNGKEPDYDKIIEEAKREVAAKQATMKKSVFGTYSSQYVSTGSSIIDYSTYEGGKYKEVAEANKWSSEIFPSNAEEQLQEYQLKKYGIIGGVLLIISTLLVFLLRRKS
jgi:hypothetical protein